MRADDSPRMRALRMLLMADGTVLFLLGVLILMFPRQVLAAFHFTDLPEGVSYLIGLWGCALVTFGIGYAIAATDAARHLVWIQIGIARGLLEAVFGAWCVTRQLVTWEQAGFGIILAAFVALAYLVLYPRKEEKLWAASRL